MRRAEKCTNQTLTRLMDIGLKFIAGLQLEGFESFPLNYDEKMGW